ncbi:class I SAM-dependent methyltransferase [Cyanobium gracile]|uniref:Class I SAM-dependent methyltransferase n=1 Tax=Cyanobium gracile UHCC 0281 TaxID=3110309 RepID=A0ABU5SR01_9CYAN|nr:class I SAM-dependent methyltransferase [Cyanobium gracile]MEA5440934.1 class I SAM-dependent methyltransferase [Cyanobium gracile UHCC 0281]
MKHVGVLERELSGWHRLRAWLKARSPLERLVAAHRGPRLFKWQHYYRIYDQHFRHWRGKPITILEIGIGSGGSLQLWKRYFGRSCSIIGVDVLAHNRRHAGSGIIVEIGSQDDAAFLEQVALKHGPFDIVIDDGSHIHSHQKTTFDTLFPHLKDGGIYACEDLCSSYWKDEFNGGPGVSTTFAEFLKSLIDELNGWFWKQDFGLESTGIGRSTASLKFYPALAILTKHHLSPPVVLHVGAPD